MLRADERIVALEHIHHQAQHTGIDIGVAGAGRVDLGLVVADVEFRKRFSVGVVEVDLVDHALGNDAVLVDGQAAAMEFDVRMT